MVIVGLETKGGTNIPSALRLSPHPLTCAVSQEGEQERGPGHGGDHPRVLPSGAPQLTQNFPHASPFPSSYSDRGRAHSCK